MKKKSVLILGIITAVILFGYGIFIGIMMNAGEDEIELMSLVVIGIMVAYAAIILVLSILSYKGKRGAAIALCILGCPMVMPLIAGIIALRRPKEGESASEVKRSSALIAVSVIVVMIYLAMLIVGILFTFVIQSGSRGIFNGVALVALAMVPSILIYFASLSNKTWLRITLSVIGVIAVIAMGIFNSSVLFEKYVDMSEMNLFWTFGLTVAPYVGAVGFALMSILPLIALNSNKRWLCKLGAVISHPVGRLFSVILVVVLAVPLSIAILAIIMVLVALWVIAEIYKSQTGRDGVSIGSIFNKKAQGKEVYTIFANGYERRLIKIGYSVLNNDGVQRDVYEDDIGNYWISDDNGQNFYPHPDPTYIVRY